MAERTDKSASNSVLERLSAVEATLERLVSILEGRGGGGIGGQAPVQVADITQADWTALGEKLDKFEQTLGEKEKALLLMVLGAAASTYEKAGLQESPAVAGAGSSLKIAGALSRVRLSDGLKSIGSFTDKAVGGFTSPGGEVQDSIGVGGDFTCVHGDWSKDLGKLGMDDAMIRGRWNAISKVGGVGLPAAGGFGRSIGGGGFG